MAKFMSSFYFEVRLLVILNLGFSTATSAILDQMSVILLLLSSVLVAL